MAGKKEDIRPSIEQDPSAEQIAVEQNDETVLPTIDSIPSTSRFINSLFVPMRKIVSQNRRRLSNDKIDLDLTYITDRIIALGFPAENYEQFFRNNMMDTQCFLNTQHKKSYLVFNLRGNCFYDIEKFGKRVITFAMNDHHPPRLEFMAQFCRAAHHYLTSRESNVIAVHCKAGKGRTGVMICAYLVYINYYPKPRSVMDYYSIIRTVNNKGVTIPSQRRYIYYFHHLRSNKLNYLPLRVELMGVYIECPREKGRKEIFLEVSMADVTVYKGGKIKPPGSWDLEYDLWKKSRRYGDDSIDFSSNFYEDPDKSKNVISRRAYGWTAGSPRVFVEGDVRIDILATNFLGRKEKLGHIWFNTMFVCPSYCQTFYIHGDELDPYPEGLSSISEKRSLANDNETTATTTTTASASDADIAGMRPKAGSASAPVSPSSDPSVKDSARSDSNAEVQQPSTSRAEPDGASRKKSKNQQSSWKEVNSIIDPPGQLEHCPTHTIAQIHPREHMYKILKLKVKQTRFSPSEAIGHLLEDAHQCGLVKDEYHARKARIEENAASYQPIPTGESSGNRPNANGPNIIRRNPDEHVQWFPIYEIDRAHKKKTLPEKCKIFVVTRCLNNAQDKIRSDEFLNETYRKAAQLGNVEEVPEVNGTEETNEGDPIVGRPKKEKKVKKTKHEQNLLPEFTVYTEPGTADDPRATDSKYARYMTRNRDDSPSRYPAANFCCPLNPPSEPVHDANLGSSDIEAIKKDVRVSHPGVVNTEEECMKAHSSSSSADNGVNDTDEDA